MMGVESTFAGLGNTLYFCKKEDIGTEKEKWHEAKLKSIDGIKVREATEVPELKVEEPKWNTSFSLIATVEYNDQFCKFVRGMKKHQSGLRHYAHNIMRQSAKKALRKCHQHMKRCMFKRK